MCMTVKLELGGRSSRLHADRTETGECRRHRGCKAVGVLLAYAEAAMQWIICCGRREQWEYLRDNGISLNGSRG